MFASLLSLVLATSSVLALPSAVLRQTTSLCEGSSFGDGGPYTLPAINKSDSGSNVPGIRLDFSPPIGTTTSSIRSLATIDTYPEIEFPTVKLEDGALVALNADGTTGAVDLDVESGNPVTFASTAGAFGAGVNSDFNFGSIVKIAGKPRDTASSGSSAIGRDVAARDSDGGAEVYCGLAGTSPHGGNPVHPLLTLHNDAESFSLCTASSSFYDKPLDVLVYKAEDNGLYDSSSCREVLVQLVDANGL